MSVWKRAWILLIEAFGAMPIWEKCALFMLFWISWLLYPLMLFIAYLEPDVAIERGGTKKKNLSASTPPYPEQAKKKKNERQTKPEKGNNI